MGSVALKTGAHRTGAQPAPQRAARSRRLQKSLNKKAHETVPSLQAPAQAADEQLKAALAQLESMTVGKDDPNYAAALAAVRQAAAALSGTDPATGQPYAEGYAGLPAELAALQAALDEDRIEAREVTFWLVTGVKELRRLSTLADRLSVGSQRLVAANRRLAPRSGKARAGRRPGRRRHLPARRRRDVSSPPASPGSPAGPRP